MINKFLLNKILLSWGDEDGSKQTDSNIIKAGNIAVALSPYTIKCIYDELSKGVKIINLATIERDIRSHGIKVTVPQMLNIYINGKKLDMNKDISIRGILLTSEFDNIQGKKEVIFSFKLNNERVLFSLPLLFVNCIMLSEVTEFLDFDKLRELIIQYPGFEKGDYPSGINCWDIFKGCSFLKSICEIKGIYSGEGEQILTSACGINGSSYQKELYSNSPLANQIKELKK